MPNAEHDPCLQYEPLISFIKKISPEKDGRLSVVTAVDRPWELIASDELKLMLTNPEAGLFIKGYAPKAEDRERFVSSAEAALRELATLQLTFPVLPPLARCKNLLFFPLGESLGITLMRDLPKADKDAMANVILKHNLTPLNEMIGKTDLVRVGGKVYLVDPFRDDAIVIFK
jgi:hypothetical protein